MEKANKKQQAAHSPALSARGEHELVFEATETQRRVDSLQPRTGTTPSGHANFRPWIPFPVDQPVVPEAPAPIYNERRYERTSFRALLLMSICTANAFFRFWCILLSRKTRASGVDGVIRTDRVSGLRQS